MHECLRSHRQELSAACRQEELLLEEEEAENVELRPGVLRVRRVERKARGQGACAEGEEGTEKSKGIRRMC